MRIERIEELNVSVFRFRMCDKLTLRKHESGSTGEGAIEQNLEGVEW